MKAGELEHVFRQQTDDQENPPKWGNVEFMVWLNDAEIEACRRARLIVDSRTANTFSTSGTATITTPLCELTLGSGTDFYGLDERIIYLRRVKLAGRTLPLCPHDYRDLDACRPGWEEHVGAVTGYVRGLDSGQFRPYPIPNTSGTVNLLVVRVPLEPIVDPNDSPEIASRYHLNLLDWVYFRAYSKQDSEVYDPETAAKHLALFEAEFGTREKATAFEEEWARNNLPFNSEDGNY